MKQLEGQELERQRNRDIKVQTDKLEEEKLAISREAELEAARKRLAQKQVDVKALIERKSKEHEEIIEDEKQWLFRIEKETMERHQKDLEEQEAADKERIRKRVEFEEQTRIREFKLIQIREQQIEADFEVEQLIELIKVKE